jgi:hypothetical protein
MAERPEDHDARVQASFDSFHETVDPKLSPDAREAMAKLRQAASDRNGEALRTGLKDLRDRHGWLYRELAAHPRVAALLDELALIGL